ncbi:GH25 family lysozyme [Cryobacterium fucosi]|uniref:Lysozyme n=1 Tax=Cryobacterium fucosi TaxID=1259157 RepID=A0A4R9B3I0_9MICO|nr:GH25 family lysozyme [Cryobacterium fucosi]TFD74742.1 hypothetical protein E3T48_12515 [Cryobacterium fucosi]
MIQGIDVGTSQRSLNFSLARALGFDVCYVKLGGSNTGARYVAPWYTSQVDRSRSVGMRVGHYWVPNPNLDVAGDGRFFAGNLRGWTGADFIVLDNERLDAAPRLLTDSEASVWFRTVRAATSAPYAQMFMYAGAADLRGRAWPEVRALGVKLIVAMYGQNDGSYPGEPNLGGRWDTWHGHQYTSQGSLGGVVIDLNRFKESAFDYSTSTAGDVTPIVDDTESDDDMKVFANAATNVWVVGGPGIWWPIPAGRGLDYERDYGAHITLSAEDFTARAAMYLSARIHDYGVFANVDTNLWVVGGPGMWYSIPAGEGGLWENWFGARQAVDGATFEKLRIGFVGLKVA